MEVPPEIVSEQGIAGRKNKKLSSNKKPQLKIAGTTMTKPYNVLSGSRYF
jgi:hypothetical protein